MILKTPAVVAHQSRVGVPLARVAAYYVVLGLVAVAVWQFVPGSRDLLGLGGLRALTASGESLARELGSNAAGPAVGELEQAGKLLAAVMGALLLMLPVAWVYIITKQRQSYDQSMVHTMILLPIAVTGVMFIVRHSLALAFALAAVVAAIRFRNTLKDKKDTVYVFLAVGVGLAAGSQSLTLAAVMSLTFNAAVLVLWRWNVGNVYADQGGLTSRLRLGEALAVGDQRLLEAMTPARLEEVAERVMRLQAYADRKDKKKFNGLVLLHATAPDEVQRAAEAIMEEQTRRWRLAEIVPAGAGHSTLEYLVRLKDPGAAGALLAALKAGAAPHVAAAEFRSLRGLRRKES
jgi:hypothetical protein